MVINIYGIFYLISITISILLLHIYGKENKLNFNYILNIFLSTIVFGLVGSRVFGFLWFYFSYNLLSNIKDYIKSTGFFYGGFIFSLLFLSIYYFKNRKLFFNIIDIFSSILPLSQAIGRFGCYFGGCCYGKKFFIFIRVPTQLFESHFAWPYLFF